MRLACAQRGAHLGDTEAPGCTWPRYCLIRERPREPSIGVPNARTDRRPGAAWILGRAGVHREQRISKYCAREEGCVEIGV